MRRIILFWLAMLFACCLLGASVASAADKLDSELSSTGKQQVIQDHWRVQFWGDYYSYDSTGELTSSGNFGRKFEMEVTISDGILTGQGIDDTTDWGFEKPITMEGTFSADFELTLTVYEANALKDPRGDLHTLIYTGRGRLAHSGGQLFSPGHSLYGEFETTYLINGVESDQYRVEGRQLWITTEQTYIETPSPAPPTAAPTDMPEPTPTQQTQPGETGTPVPTARPSAQQEQPEEERLFVESVPLPDQISTDPGVIGTNFLFALLTVIVFYIASSIFNNTIRENYSIIKKWTSRILIPFKPLRGSSANEETTGRRAIRK
ncbi:hypothetical protein ACFLTL_02745, partial [Chloroflexota bacterium]